MSVNDPKRPYGEHPEWLAELGSRGIMRPQLNSHGRQMNRAAVFVIAILSASLAASIVAYLAQASIVARWLTWPSLIASGWAFLGHLVTLDDDMRGGWSNPDGSRAVWWRSVLELFVKLVVFAIAGWWFATVRE